MKFPDFENNIFLTRLQQQMGIRVLPPLPDVDIREIINHDITRQVANSDAVKLRRRLNDRGIDVSTGELQTDKNTLLLYKGQRVAIYIRDQKNTTEAERISNCCYHLCLCQQLRQTPNQRYIATRRNDGYFRINEITGDNINTGLVKFDICPHCREYMTYSGIYKYPFALTEYFSYDENAPEQPDSLVHNATAEQNYQPNAEELLLAYSHLVEYHCQLCGVDCSNTLFRNLLCLNYRDGNPENTDRSNLAILCLDCHYTQTGRQFRPWPNPRDLKKIHELRHEQGIISQAVFAQLS